ncbi:hypothetical protein [Streptomyces sp. NPDC047869]|uniref:hypothetical protein n=1 Tax=Streptomyces sp. NPDC047869 TaxID=3154709 RepID=UPI0034533917
MWPGEQPPGSGQQHNPYHQPGYQQYPQANPYGQQPQWGQPGPAGAPQPQPPRSGGGGGGGGGRTKLVAIVAATAVVVAAGVTGFLLLGGGKDDEARPGPTASSASPTASASASPSGEDDPRSAGSAEKPAVAGWKVVVNPDTGVAFDVPPEWQVRAKTWVTYVTDDSDPDEKVLAGMKAPAVLKEKWCGSDDDKDGRTDYDPLANVGTRGDKDATGTAKMAREQSANWVYGWYTQPDRETVRTGPVTSYTTASGVTGSVATSRSSGVPKHGKCDYDGKATTFAFKDADGAFLAWSFVGAAGVSEEVPDTTVRKIMATVRLYKE